MKDFFDIELQMVVIKPLIELAIIGESDDISIITLLEYIDSLYNELTNDYREFMQKELYKLS